MSKFVDNLLAFRILFMLVTPFEKTKAFKYGIIDKDGNALKKTRDLTTTEEKNAYTQLDKLVFSLKRLLGKVPGGKSQFASIIAAYYLIKESYETNSRITAEQYTSLVDLLENKNFTLVEEEILVEEFMNMFEDGAIANVTGAATATNEPVIRVGKSGRKFGAFNVPDQVFRRFAKGKKKFTKWSDYLNTEDEEESKVYDYARKNPKGVLVLKNGDMTKAIRFNKNGGGNWHKLKRPIKTQQYIQTEDI